MKNKRYYKITTEIAGEQVSFVVFNSKAEAHYQVGKWIEAPVWLAKEGYGLFVFDGLKNVREYARKEGWHSWVRAWRCEIDGRYRKLPANLSMVGLKYGVLIPVEVSDYPKGTVMVRRVKLVRQIHIPEETK